MAAGHIIVVSHNDATHLREALRSCARWAPEVPVIVVDNASSDGTIAMLRDQFPEVQLLAQTQNLGYGAGCNAGIAAACDSGAQWVMLLNQDAVLTDSAVQRLAAFLDATPAAAAVQPAVMRPDGRCNSLGNPQHVLGFSFAGGNGETVAEAERDPALPWLRDGSWRSGTRIPVFSGAAVMLRTAALNDAGAFEPALFLYHEDFELSLRLRERGWVLHLLGSAVVVHDYSFSRNARKWYHLERNRHWVLQVHYERRTLLTLAVPLLAAELAVWLRALREGWAGEKLRSYACWTDPDQRAHARRRRAWVQAHRVITDAELLASATTMMSSGEGPRRGAAAVVERAAAVAWRGLRPLIR
jgi:GT2 family glycosyltransferase